MRTLKYFLSFLFVIITGCTVTKHAQEPKPSIESIKSLAGDWRAEKKDEETGKFSTVSYRLISGATAVEETLGKGTPHEMVSIYHKDGEDLAMTHYCMLDNQPYLKATKQEGSTILFEFAGGNNLNPDKDMHIHELRLTLKDTDHIRQDWVGYNEGKEAHVKSIDFVRLKKNK